MSHNADSMVRPGQSAILNKYIGITQQRIDFGPHKKLNYDSYSSNIAPTKTIGETLGNSYLEAANVRANLIKSKPASYLKESSKISTPTRLAVVEVEVDLQAEKNDSVGSKLGDGGETTLSSQLNRESEIRPEEIYPNLVIGNKPHTDIEDNSRAKSFKYSLCDSESRYQNNASNQQYPLSSDFNANNQTEEMNLENNKFKQQFSPNDSVVEEKEVLNDMLIGDNHLENNSSVKNHRCQETRSQNAINKSFLVKNVSQMSTEDGTGHCEYFTLQNENSVVITNADVCDSESRYQDNAFNKQYLMSFDFNANNQTEEINLMNNKFGHQFSTTDIVVQRKQEVEILNDVLTKNNHLENNSSLKNHRFPEIQNRNSMTKSYLVGNVRQLSAEDGNVQSENFTMQNENPLVITNDDSFKNEIYRWNEHSEITHSISSEKNRNDKVFDKQDIEEGAKKKIYAENTFITNHEFKKVDYIGVKEEPLQCISNSEQIESNLFNLNTNLEQSQVNEKSKSYFDSVMETKPINVQNYRSLTDKNVKTTTMKSLPLVLQTMRQLRKSTDYDKEKRNDAEENKNVHDSKTFKTSSRYQVFNEVVEKTENVLNVDQKVQGISNVPNEISTIDALEAISTFNFAQRKAQLSEIDSNELCPALQVKDKTPPIEKKTRDVSSHMLSDGKRNECFSNYKIKTESSTQNTSVENKMSSYVTSELVEKPENISKTDQKMESKSNIFDGVSTTYLAEKTEDVSNYMTSETKWDEHLHYNKSFYLFGDPVGKYETVSNTNQEVQSISNDYNEISKAHMLNCNKIESQFIGLDSNNVSPPLHTISHFGGETEDISCHMTGDVTSNIEDFRKIDNIIGERLVSSMIQENYKLQDSVTREFESLPDNVNEESEKYYDFFNQISEMNYEAYQYEKDIRKYKSAPNSRTYHYIEESLVRIQLRLDKLNIDHSERLRMKRKEVIKYINQLLRQLDSYTHQKR